MASNLKIYIDLKKPFVFTLENRLFKQKSMYQLHLRINKGFSKPHLLPINNLTHQSNKKVRKSSKVRKIKLILDLKTYKVSPNKMTLGKGIIIQELILSKLSKL